MDGPSQAEQSFLARPFALGTRLILAYPWTTIIVCIGLAILASIYSGAKLGYRTSRLDLLNPKSAYNKIWLEYSKEFGDEEDAVIVVEGADRQKVIPVIDELAAATVANERMFHSVFHQVDLQQFRSKGLYYLAPQDLLGVEQFLGQMAPVAKGNWSLLTLGNLAGAQLMRLDALTRQADAAAHAATLGQLRQWCGSLLASLRGAAYKSPWPDMRQSFSSLGDLSSQYLLAKEGKFGFIQLRLNPDVNVESLTHDEEATEALRAIIAKAQARHPEVKIGLTGLPVMENDEMRSSQWSMFWASLVSMIGVAILFVAGFGGIRHALLANLILLIGMAWAFAYVTFTVGHLNILSISFTATLIGIGIDYGVYYAARYLNLRRENYGCEEALIETSRGAGPAITTGAITTAVAFFAAGFTSFTGVAELGIIAGGGLLLCAVAELTVLPASIYLIDRSGWGIKMPAPLPVHKWIMPFVKLPRVTLVATLLFTVAMSFGLSRLWYDNNLLNMQAVGLESVELERKLLTECNQSVWYALSVADTREELLARKEKFQRLASVDRTEEIVSMLPGDVERSRPIVERIAGQLHDLPQQAPLIPVERPEKLQQVLSQIQAMVSRDRGNEALAGELGQAIDLLRRLPAADCSKLLSQLQQQVAGDLLVQLQMLKSVANPEPPRLDDVPASLSDRFVGKHGRFLLKIYGKGNTWDAKALSRFVNDVRRVDPRVTGNPLQAHEASMEMKHSYQEAAIYSLLVIIGVLVLDFRNLRDAMLAALPLGIGVLQTFGLLGLLDIPLNPANLIALPLILGIGVDYGVHIVHEFREQQGPYRMSAGTAVAVLVDALTTIAGYGAMMIATHQGLQSLGRVLTLAVTCCLFSSLVMLPALLTWMTRNRPEAQTPGVQVAVVEEPEAAEPELELQAAA